MKSVVHDAKDLLSMVDLYSVPVNPIEVCEKLDIIYDEKPYSGFEGTLLVTANSQLIGVSSNIKDAGRKAFTCAHELGHYYYDLEGTASVFNCTRDDTGHGKQKLDPKEVRANEFSSELLMPQELFLNRIKNQQPSWGLIEKLANEFGTSLQATAHKYIRMASHSCWLIVVKNGKLQRYTKADFNEFAPNLNGTFKVPKVLPTDWKQTLATSWLHSTYKTNGKEIFYWPLKENQYGESLVLLWDPKNVLLEDPYKDSYSDDDDDYSRGSGRW